MVKKITYTIITIWLCTFFAHGQIQPERVQALMDSSYQYSRYDFTKCIEFIDSSLSFSNYDKESYFEDLSHYYYGICNHRHGFYNEAIEQFDKGILRFTETNDSTILSDLFYQKSLVFRQQSDYKQFLENVNKSLELSEAIDYSKNIGMCNNAKLIYYKERKMYKLAEECGIKSLSIFKTIRDSSSQGDVYNNLGVLMFEQNKFDKALEFHLLQHNLNTMLNNVWGMGYSHSKLAIVYAEQKKYSLAKSHVEDALQITRTIGTPYELSGVLLRSAQLNSKIGNYNKAIRDVHESMALSKKFEQLNSYAEGLEKLVNIHKKQNLVDSALIYTDMLMNVNNSVLNQTIGKQLIELEVEFETHKKDKEILELKYEDDLNEARIVQQRIIIGSSLLGLGLLGFLFFRVRGKNQKIKEQNNIISIALSEKDMLLREVHHRVKNNLQVISSLLSLQSRYIKDEKAIEAINEGRTRVRSMALIHQSLYQKDNLVGVNVKEYFSQLIHELFDTYKVSKNEIELKLDLQEVTLDVDTIIPLGLILNELVTNSLKYAFTESKNGFIKVSLFESNNQLKLTVQDNGKGIDNNKMLEQPNTFGYKLIHAFAKKMKSEISIQSDQGMTVEILINNYQKAS